MGGPAWSYQQALLMRAGARCLSAGEMRTFTLLLAAAHVGLACYIAGSDSGRCDYEMVNKDYRIGTKLAGWLDAALPHCGKYVKYPACVPDTRKQLPPDRNFPNGRWYNHTMKTKDEWVLKQTVDIIKARKFLEVDQKTKEKMEMKEHGSGKGRTKDKDRTSLTWRFSRTAYGGGGADCVEAFRAYMCYINFPRCDDEGNSLVTCRSACENYFHACKYGKNDDLKRCGDSDLMNGYSREKRHPDKKRYMRDFFPGQPFRDFIPAYCTPGLKDAALRLELSWLHVASVMLALVTLAGPAVFASPQW